MSVQRDPTLTRRCECGALILNYRTECIRCEVNGPETTKPETEDRP